MSDIERAIVEPDVGFYGDGADGEGLVEGDLLMLSVHVINFILRATCSVPSKSYWLGALLEMREEEMRGDEMR